MKKPMKDDAAEEAAEPKQSRKKEAAEERREMKSAPKSKTSKRGMFK